MNRLFTLMIVCLSVLSAQSQLEGQEEPIQAAGSEEATINDTLQPIVDESVPDTVASPAETDIEPAESAAEMSEGVSEEETDVSVIDTLQTGSPAEITETSMESATTDSIEIAGDKPVLIMSEMPDAPDSLMTLEYGYKGYPWGTPNKTVWPRLNYMGKPRFSDDTTAIIITGTLEGVNAEVYYAFSDSGFWKVEIDYDLSDLTIEKQIEKFTTVEKNLAENYGNILSTSRNLSGPHTNKSGSPAVKFNRAYYHSSWSPTPCKVDLVLFSMVQTEPEDLSILERNTGFLKLVYYNPDYMIIVPEDEEPEKLPSIFELY